MQFIRANGATSNTFRVLLRRSDTGQGLTGLTFSSAGLIISTICDNESSATIYTAAGSTIETITTLGTFAAPTATKCRFKEVDATNHAGLYEVQLADARYAVTGAKFLHVTLSAATTLLEKNVQIQLSKIDLDDATRGGMTSLPNANANANGGLPILSSGASTLNYTVPTVTTTATATNLTNAPTNGDFTAAMKTSLNAATPASITGAVGSVTGNVGGDVQGKVLGGGASNFSAVGVQADVEQWGTAGIANTQQGLPYITANVVRDGTAQAGGASSITLDSGASATDNLYRGCVLWIRGGVGAGQSRTIVSYVGSSKVATVDSPWVTNPTNASFFSLLAGDNPKLDASNRTTDVNSANLDVAISSRSTYAGGAADTNIGAVKAKTDLIGTNAADSPNEATAQAGITNLLARLPANIFNGITRLAYWLMLGYRKEADATTLAEVNANNAVGTPGAYDPTLDSLDAIRERGDAAWTGGGGGNVTVAITPLMAQISGGPGKDVTITAYVGSALTNLIVSVFDNAGNPVNLANTVEIRVYTPGVATPLFTSVATSYTANQATFNIPSTNHTAPGNFRCAIWEVGGAFGDVRIVGGDYPILDSGTAP
jgi:hypothetical protein